MSEPAVSTEQSLSQMLSSLEREGGPSREVIDVLLTSLDSMVQLNLTQRFSEGEITQPQFNNHLLKLRALVALGRELVAVE